MENESSIKDIITNSLQQIRTIIDADTIVGKQIVTENGTVIIPISKLSMGFASGGLDLPSKNSNGSKNFGGGGGTGVTVSPIGFLTISPDGKVYMLPIAQEKSGAMDQIFDLLDQAPDLIKRVKNALTGEPDTTTAEEELERTEAEIAEQLEKELRPSVLGNLVGQKGAKTDRRLKKLESSCYLCGRIESQFSRMIATCVYLYGTDSAFRKKLVASPMLCLPHAKRLLEEGSAKLQKKYYSDFFDGVYTVAENYMKGLRSDVSAFCRSFDYRYQEENVGSAKDSVERTIRYLTSVER